MRLPTFYEQNLIPNWGNILIIPPGVARLTEMVVPLLKVIVIPERLNSSSDNMTGAI